MRARSPRTAPAFTDSNLMPIAASLVVGLNLIGVLSRWRSAAWYEWVFAVAGAGGAVGFWVWELRRARRARRRGPDFSKDDEGGDQA